MLNELINSFLNFIYLRWLGLTIILLSTILVLSLYPINNLITSTAGNDKIFHLLSYLILSFPMSYKKPTSYRLIFIFFVCFGGLIEIVQPIFSRSRELLDFISNTIGIILGMIMGHLVKVSHKH